ncbi:MSH2 protein [Coemansia asiatica]|uniref:DNA mismatch repair protein MSH2 n=1 Tax=Coemansia asiatica TaxID=1052880 RepID=A0A9W7XJL1_9FUNG|nr:MSH2 protein [Coemansia asiatica]
MPGESAERPDLNLDKTSEQGFCQFFASLAEQENTIKLFERSNGEYYSVHGDDAELVAMAVYKTPTVIKYIGGAPPKGLASCTMSRTVAEGFLRDALLDRQQRIEIYALQEGTSGSWRVAKTASPGNLQAVEDMLFSSADMVGAPLMAIKVRASMDQMHVGVAMVDTAQRTMGVCEFIDNDVFSSLEALVIQLGVRECLVEDDETIELRNVGGVLQRCSVIATACARKQFSSGDIQQDLARLLQTTAPVGSLPELELKSAMGALNAAMLYLGLLADETNYGGYTLYTHSLAQFMKLDASAVEALSLLHSPRDGASRTMSIQGLLNCCKTAQGRRLLAQWLKQPLLNVDAIDQRLDLVEAFFADAETRNSLRLAHMRSMPDLKRLATRLQRGLASLQDIVRIYQVAAALPMLCDALTPLGQANKVIETRYLEPLKASDTSLGSLRTMVETTVDLEMADRHEFVLRADFDEGLQETRALMDAEMQRINDELEQVGRTLDLEPHRKLKLERHATFGHCFRVTRTDSGRLRGRSAKFFELSTQKTGVLFTTAALREASRTYRDLSNSYSRTQSALVREVIKVAASYSPVLESLNSTIADLDVILSFAEASATALKPYVRPIIRETGDLVLRGARHPCLEVQDNVDFIANDIELIDGRCGFVVITGPNMGGKSTYIRQAGVIALMAQIGCFVPCESAELPLFDCILARVGAGDAQLKGVSTFMAEMLETASILKTATERSLVIIDELGRGTSTYDGFGLAWAISEHIAREIKCKCLFATHFHELTELAKEYPNVANRHAMACITPGNGKNERGELTLLYRIVDGICDQSFGIHVAELASFPDSVVRLAKSKAEELEDFQTSLADDTTMDIDCKESGGPRSFDSADMARGSRFIESFLAEFVGTPGLSDMLPKDVAQRVNELRSKYDAEISSNPWIQHVIATL